MAYEERVQILSEAEQGELYWPPAFTSADQCYFFSLNDKKLAIAKCLSHRGQRYMLLVLLGYFKAKPVVLNPGFNQIKHDLKYVYRNALPGPGCRRFILTPKRTNGFTTVFFRYVTSAPALSPTPSFILTQSAVDELRASERQHKDTDRQASFFCRLV